MGKPLFRIKDWAGNLPFGEETFREFDEAWDRVYTSIEQRYGIPQSEAEEKAFEELLGEYHVEQIGGSDE